MIKIESVLNGYIVRSDDEVYVVEEMGSEYKAFVEVLLLVNQLIGPPSSRHSEERIYVEVRPGDKWIGREEEEDNE